ncbi:unnamed protein product [Vitrella brassicaformis CCMP3155]|uniref:Anaphase-promoting complex subunit 4 WD40 domain-containing protein n=2 Tax=Vitrella brassicaformis TaxID=1169539 RepID=A0A0G4GPD0_VITBC|nr:unnamed protein product [Vitrella brassicaformis CCMP3155]|eukprot:CEM32240.1 unnamed protein product [Vitrella brassicaformis CCMP3155]
MGNLTSSALGTCFDTDVNRTYKSGQLGFLQTTRKSQRGVSREIARVGDHADSTDAWGLQMACDAAHDDYVRCLAVLPRSNLIVSGGGDSVIRVWSAETGRLLREVENDSLRVFLVREDHNELLAGARDGSITVYDTKSWKVKTAFMDDSGSVFALAEHHYTLISGSDHIAIWTNPEWRPATDPTPGHTGMMEGRPSMGREVIRGQRGAPLPWGGVWRASHVIDEASRSLMVHDGKLYVGAIDRALKVYDLKTLECIETLVHHERCIWSMLVVNQFLVTGSADFTLGVWRFAKEDGEPALQLVASLGDHSGWIVQLLSYGNKLVTACLDGFVRVWDTHGDPVDWRRVKVIEVSENEENEVYSVAAIDNKLVTASSDGAIHVYFDARQQHEQRQSQ